jgi:F0F1-type ATP synthase membrane subunit a
MMNSPFEQFEVTVISFFGLDFSFSNLTLYLVLAIIVILILSYLMISLIFNHWQNIIEFFLLLYINNVSRLSEKKAKVFFPAIFSLFLFILVEFFFFSSGSGSDFSQMMLLSFIKPKSISHKVGK